MIVIYFAGVLVYSMQNYQDTSILKSKYLTTPIKWNH